MERVAEGRENLKKGTYNTFLGAWYTTFVLDGVDSSSGALVRLYPARR